MKNLLETTQPITLVDQATPIFSEKQILTPQAMRSICGGDGPGNGSVPIIIIPKGPL